MIAGAVCISVALRTGQHIASVHDRSVLDRVPISPGHKQWVEHSASLESGTDGARRRNILLQGPVIVIFAQVFGGNNLRVACTECVPKPSCNHSFAQEFYSWMLTKVVCAGTTGMETVVPV